MKDNEETLGNWAKTAEFYTSDSRHINKKGIFVALKGEKNDGHSYVRQVLETGCRGVVVEKNQLQDLGAMANDPRVLAVKNTNEAHRFLAHEFRKKFQKPVIGVGGSSGKTSTKDFLAHLLAGTYKVFKTQKSQNGEQGIPKTLENLNNAFDLAVIEIGIDAPGDMQRHVEVVDPDTALLTSIGEEHLNLLKSVENVFNEEKKLFDFVWQKGGFCFAPKADAYLASLGRPELRLTPSRPQELDSRFECDLEHPYLLQNAALATAVALHMKCKPESIATQLKTLQIPEGRGGVLWKSPQLALVSDYYNSNPSSLRAGIENAMTLARNRSLPLVLILGDMLDLGEESENQHLKILKEMSSFKHQIYLVGPQMKHAAQVVKNLKVEKIFMDQSEAMEFFKSHRLDEGVVLIKGSRGIGLESVFKALNG